MHIRNSFYSRFVPGLVLPAYDLLGRSATWQEVKHLRELQWRSPEHLEQRSLVKLKALLNHAYEKVPFYHDSLRQSGVAPSDIESLADMAKLPVLSREQVRLNYEGSLLARGVPASRRKESFTSGSSGLPLGFYKDKKAKRRTTASTLFFREWAGINPWDTLLWLASPPHFVEYASQNTLFMEIARRYLLGEVIITCPGIDLTLEGLQQKIRNIPQRRDYWIGSYPSYMGRLASQIIEQKTSLARYPKVVMTYAEPLSPETAQRISHAFQCPVHDIFGIQETPYLGQSCPDNPELIHLNSEYSLIRVVDQAGNDLEPGQTGRILFTDLHNQVMPLINYELGDLATKGGVCSCGRGLPTLQAIQGRVGELIHTPDGRSIAPVTFGHFLFYVHDYLPYVWEFQLHQLALDQVKLMIVTTGQYTIQCRTRLLDDLQAFLGAEMQIDVQEVEQLPSEASGKRLVVKSHIN